LSRKKGREFMIRDVKRLLMPRIVSIRMGGVSGGHGRSHVPRLAGPTALGCCVA
jgi:hypothetical protein